MCQRRRMCCCCCKPRKSTGRPEDCTPEQVRECHGDDEEHPCVPESETQDSK